MKAVKAYSKYEYEFDSDQETQFFVVTREVIGTIEYTVEATSLQDAISQIEADETENIMEEDVGDIEEFKKGRVLSARIDEKD